MTKAGEQGDSHEGGASRAVRVKGQVLIPRVLGVELDRFHDQIQLVIGAVDLARDTIIPAGGDGAGFGEVIQAIEPAGVAVLHQEHPAGAGFDPFDQEEMIGAEVDHKKFRVGLTSRCGGD